MQIFSCMANCISGIRNISHTLIAEIRNLRICFLWAFTKVSRKHLNLYYYIFMLQIGFQVLYVLKFKKYVYNNADAYNVYLQNNAYTPTPKKQLKSIFTCEQ